MRYSEKFGNYGIYMDNMLYGWYKTLENAMIGWNDKVEDPECLAEWLEEYDVLELRNMRTGEVIERRTNEMM